MALLFQCNDIKKDFGIHSVLKQVSFDIEIGERIGLVGINGCGKTTLANIIYGSTKPDGGDIKWHRNDVKIGYLRQSVFYTSSIMHEFLSEGDNTGHIKDFLHTASMLGTQKMHEWEDDRFDSLSSGEKTKIALARVWADEPDLLILDEPTNHLDFGGVGWLIDELKSYKGTIIIISHDRYFLDEIIGRILEIDNGSIQEYRGNYSYYRREKDKRHMELLHAYQTQEKYKRKLDEQIRQLKGWSGKAHRDSTKGDSSGNKMGTKEYKRAKAKKTDKKVKSKIKRLEKLKVDGIKRPVAEDKVKFAFDNASKRGKLIIEAQDIGKAFGDRTLFSDSSFYILRGDRIGIFGDNGCGKTTLIKAFMGQDTVSGSLFITPSAKIGYVSQDVLDISDDTMVLDMFNIPDRRMEGTLRTMLANLGFDELDLNKPVRELSLGERTKLKLANLIYHEYDVLILDEPTNHLDLHAREQLEDALRQYEGTIILVTHDRYMLEHVCEKLLVFKQGNIRRIEQSPVEYLEGKRTSYRINKEAREEEVRNNDRPGALNSKDSEEEPTEDLIVLDNKITTVLGKLSMVKPNTEMYKELDEEYKELVARKRSFNQQ